MECAAVLDACRVLELASAERVKGARTVLLRIVHMLSKMCRRRSADHAHDHADDDDKK